MAKPKNTFREIRDELPAKEWVSFVQDSQPIREVEFPWGTPLPKEGFNALGPREIGVILSGEAEVCEEHWLNSWGSEHKSDRYACPCAYRPIRHLETGDIFGDFSLLDRAVFTESVMSRPFEKWNVVFGGRSAIFLGNIKDRPDQEYGTPDKRPDQDCFEDAAGRRALHHLIDRAMSKRRTRVAYIRWRPEDDLNAFLRGIFPSSWKRAYTYRLASNSYNIRHKFVFLGRAKTALKTHSRSAGTKRKHAYPDRVNYTEIAPAFIEAIYDALNRPIRDEPVFACMPLNSDDSDIQAVLRSGRIGRPARISRHPSISEFFFPIGLSNFIICNYANSMQQMETFYDGIGVRGFKKPDPGKGARPDYHADAGGSKGSGLYFWKEAADLIIESHATVNPESDEREGYARSAIESGYSVSCEVIPSFDGRLELYLKYART